MASLDSVSIAVFLGAALVMAGILSSLLALRFGAPLLLVFLAIGMLAGDSGPGQIQFSDVRTTYLDGSELREQLLALSDLEQSFSYCLLDTPIPMFNYVAHVRLLPVTDGDRTFWHWESRFTTKPEDRDRITHMVAEDIYQAGFEAIRRQLKEAA